MPGNRVGPNRQKKIAERRRHGSKKTVQLKQKYELCLATARSQNRSSVISDLMNSRVRQGCEQRRLQQVVGAKIVTGPKSRGTNFALSLNIHRILGGALYLSQSCSSFAVANFYFNWRSSRVILNAVICSSSVMACSSSVVTLLSTLPASWNSVISCYSC